MLCIYECLYDACLWSECFFFQKLLQAPLRQNKTEFHLKI